MAELAFWERKGVGSSPTLCTNFEMVKERKREGVKE